jgi:hypothetical protein
VPLRPLPRLGTVVAAILLGACSSPPPAQVSEPPSVPAPAAEPTSAPRTGTLAVHILGGAQVAPGQHLAPDDQLVFDLSGSAGSYLYLLEQGGGTLTVLYPREGWVSPATEAVKRVVPQSTWTAHQDELVAGWTPQSVGHLEYLLVSAPTPRGATADQRLEGGLEQILAPPPFVMGPAGAAATVVARLSVVRNKPPEEP